MPAEFTEPRSELPVPDRRCTKVLEQEHQTIHKVAAAMSVVADRLDEGQAVDSAVLRDFSSFLHHFSEECHHAKEERFLFPLLEARGIPASGCPLAVLNHEHQKGRALLTQLDDSIQVFASTGADKNGLVLTLRDLVRLYIGHMWKEDYLLLPMADKVLSDQDQAKLCDDFASIEKELGSGKHLEMEQLSSRLQRVLPAAAGRA